MPKGRRSNRKVFLCALAIGLSARFAAALTPSTGAVVPGVWNSGYDKCLSYARQNHLPLVIVLSQRDCDYCEALASAIDKDTAFATWQASMNMVFCYYSSTKEYPLSDDPTYIKIYDDVVDDREKGYMRYPETSGKRPKIRLLWEKEDGTVLRTTFVGREADADYPNGYMWADARGRSLSQQLKASIESFFYGDDSVCGFSVGSEAGHRLELEPTTGLVYVPVEREGSTAVPALTNYVEAVYPDGVALTNEVVFGSQQSRAYAQVTNRAFQLDGVIGLRLLNGARLTYTNDSQIAMVGPLENCPANPHWVGEYGAEDLPYGEWTMDFDAAKEKVALSGGRIIAAFAGPLWCPNCETMDRDVFAQPAFKDWAKKNSIVLVHFDQGQASSPSTPAGTPRGRLLTYTPSTKGKSGASYLSRHGLHADMPEVTAAIDRVTDLTDAWLAPETTAARLANPVLLLLDPKGQAVVGRFVRQNVGYTMDLDENMGRLADFLKLADRADETSDYLTTTKLVHAIGGETTAALQVNDSREFYRIGDLSRGRFVFSVKASSPSGTPQLTVYRDGASLTNGQGSVSVDLRTSQLGGHAYHLRVSEPRYDARSELLCASGTTVYSATVRSEKQDLPFVPGEIAFASGDFAVNEDGCKPGDWQTVEIAVARVNGEDGELSGEISLVDDAAAQKALADGRIAWAGTRKLTWNDGETLVKRVSLKVFNDNSPDGDCVLSFRLGSSVLKVTIHEDDGVEPGTLELVSTAERRVVGGASLSVPVRRVGGNAGAFSSYLQVVLDGETSKTGAETVWPAYDRTVERTLTVGVPAVKVAACGTLLLAGDGINPLRRSARLVVYPADCPHFELPVISVKGGLSGSLAADAVIANCLAGQKGEVVAGALPAGVVASIEGGRLTLRGVAQETGLFRAVYRLEGGTDVTLEISVEGEVAAGAYHDVPLFSSGRLAGAVTVVRQASGRRHVVLRSAEGTRVIGSDDVGLVLSVDASGNGSVAYGDLQGTLALDDWSEESDASAWGGTYTVQLVQTNAPSAETAAPLGLTMTLIDATAGRMAWRCFTPTGKMFAGLTTLHRAGAKATLPVFAADGGETLGLWLEIDANAKSVYKSQRWVVKAADGVSQCWNGSALAVYGGYFDVEELKASTEVSYAGGGKPAVASLKTDGAHGFVYGTVDGCPARLVVLPGWDDCDDCDDSLVRRPYAAGTSWKDAKVEAIEMRVK